MDLSVRSPNLEGLDRKLGQASDNASDARPAMQKVAEDNRDRTVEQFASAGGLTGGWDSLAPETIDRKGFSTVLFRSGNLRRALTTNLGEVKRDGWRLQLKGREGALASLHQSGTRHMPSREVLVFGTEQQREAAQTVVEHIMEPFDGR